MFWIRKIFFPDSTISPSTRDRIRCVSLDLEGGFKDIRIRRMSVGGSRVYIKKENVADLKISGHVWTGPKNLSHFDSSLSEELYY